MTPRACPLIIRIRSHPATSGDMDSGARRLSTRPGVNATISTFSLARCSVALGVCYCARVCATCPAAQLRFPHLSLRICVLASCWQVSSRLCAKLGAGHLFWATAAAGRLGSSEPRTPTEPSGAERHPHLWASPTALPLTPLPAWGLGPFTLVQWYSSGTNPNVNPRHCRHCRHRCLLTPYGRSA